MVSAIEICAMPLRRSLTYMPAPFPGCFALKMTPEGRSTHPVGLKREGWPGSTSWLRLTGWAQLLHTKRQ